MDIAEKKVAILVDDYFEEAEFAEPLKALKDAAVTVTVVGASGKSLHALQHVKPGGSYQADLLLDDVDFEDFDALVLPGGVVNADKLRMNDLARNWVRHCVEAGKPLAAICHAPWVLVSAGVIDGLRLTSYYTLQDDIRNAGGEWEDSQLVIDDRVITSRKPDDLPAFTAALLQMLQDDHDQQLNEEAYSA